MVDTDEKTDENNDTGKKPDSDPKKDEPLSLIEEARKLNEEIIKSKNELKEEREKMQKVQAESLLSGTGGGHVDSKPAKETDHEYRMRIQKEMAEGKTDFGN